MALAFQLASVTSLSFAPCAVAQEKTPASTVVPTKDIPARFVDITKQVGVHFEYKSSHTSKKYLIETMAPGVALFDYDNDGRLDIFLVNGAPLEDPTPKGTIPKKTGPAYWNRLYHQKSDGTFEDVTEKAGLQGEGYSMGVAVGDYDNDGYEDLYVTAYGGNRLYHNNGNGTFTEKAVVAGVAFSEDGVARAGMGVDAVDYDRSGATSLLITNFSNQMLSLYHNEGKGLFVDEAPRSEIGRASLLTLGFGCFFFDYDLDGWPDILIANGHIDSDIQRVQPNVKYAMPPHLFRNRGKGDFVEVTSSLGAAFAAPRVGQVECRSLLQVLRPMSQGGEGDAMPPVIIVFGERLGRGAARAAVDLFERAHEPNAVSAPLQVLGRRLAVQSVLGPDTGDVDP